MFSKNKNNDMQKVYFKTFNKIYFELLEFIKQNSNNNRSFKSFYMKNYMMKKANIKMFIRKWHENISIPYNKPIFDGNVDFFLEKDYDGDLTNMGSLSNELSLDYYVEYFKNIYSELDKELIYKFIEFVQALTKLTFLYYNIKSN